MTPDEYIKEFYSLLYRMSKDGFINKPDKFVAVNDIELAVHKLQQAFDRDISDKKRVTSNPEKDSEKIM
jgi:hypothetical protein